MDKNYDLIVIGAGSAGVRLARRAAGRGTSVAIFESSALGGTCVNVGCIPKKLYSYAAQYMDTITHAEGYGITANGTFDWATLRANKSASLANLNQIYLRLLEQSGADLVREHATITGPNSVQAAGQDYKAKHIAVCTGGWPTVPSWSGAELADTSNEIFDLPVLPNSIAIVGGGYVAVEFAGIFQSLGVQVHLIYRGSHILKHFDTDLGDFLVDQMRKRDISVHLSTDVEKLTRLPGGDIGVAMTDGQNIEVTRVLAATGRHPRLDGLGLDTVGVTLDQSGHIVVNANYQSSVPSIYALGDVIAAPQLTPVAINQANALEQHLFGDGSCPSLHYDSLATAVFSQPNIATVGLSQERAQQLHPDDITVYRSEFRPLKHSLTTATDRTLMKLIVQTSTDKVVGLHMVGEYAGEIVQGFAVAIRAGATKADFDSTIGIHPTSAEEFVTMRDPVQ